MGNLRELNKLSVKFRKITTGMIKVVDVEWFPIPPGMALIDPSSVMSVRVNLLAMKDTRKYERVKAKVMTMEMMYPYL